MGSIWILNVAELAYCWWIWSKCPYLFFSSSVCLTILSIESATALPFSSCRMDSEPLETVETLALLLSASWPVLMYNLRIVSSFAPVSAFPIIFYPGRWWYFFWDIFWSKSGLYKKHSCSSARTCQWISIFSFSSPGYCPSRALHCHCCPLVWYRIFGESFEYSQLAGIYLLFSPIGCYCCTGRKTLWISVLPLGCFLTIWGPSLFWLRWALFIAIT